MWEVFLLLDCEKWLWVCRLGYLPFRVSDDQGNPTHQCLVQPRKETVWKLWKTLILKVKHLLFFRFMQFPSCVCSCYYPAPRMYSLDFPVPLPDCLCSSSLVQCFPAFLLVFVPLVHIFVLLWWIFGFLLPTWSCFTRSDWPSHMWPPDTSDKLKETQIYETIVQ